MVAIMFLEQPGRTVFQFLFNHLHALWLCGFHLTSFNPSFLFHKIRNMWLPISWRRRWHPTPVLLPGKSHGWRTLVGCSPWGRWGSDRLSDFTFTFHFHALEKEMATHSSVLAWRIPGTGEAGGLPSMGSHRVGHDWSDLVAHLLEILWRLNKVNVISLSPSRHSTMILSEQ